MVLSHLWMESPYRLSDYVAHPNLAMQAVVDVLRVLAPKARVTCKVPLACNSLHSPGACTKVASNSVTHCGDPRTHREGLFLGPTGMLLTAQVQWV